MREKRRAPRRLRYKDEMMPATRAREKMRLYARARAAFDAARSRLFDAGAPMPQDTRVARAQRCRAIAPARRPRCYAMLMLAAHTQRAMRAQDVAFALILQRYARRDAA